MLTTSCYIFTVEESRCNPSYSQAKVCSRTHLSPACFTEAIRAVLPMDTSFGITRTAVVGYLEENFIPTTSHWCSIMAQHLAVTSVSRTPAAAASSGQFLHSLGAAGRISEGCLDVSPHGKVRRVRISHVFTSPWLCNLFSIWIKLNWLRLANVKFSKDNFYFNYCGHRKRSSLRKSVSWELYITLEEFLSDFPG